MRIIESLKTTDSGILVPDDYKFFDAKLNYGLTQKQLEEQSKFPNLYNGAGATQFYLRNKYSEFL